MNEQDKHLLILLQDGVPLVRRPWKQLSDVLGMDPADVLRCVREMRQSGIIRRIGGVFDARRLGYRLTLLGLSIPEAHLEPAAEIVGEHPGVSHCYARDDEYNLWATLAVSSESTLGLERTVEILANHAKAKAYLNLPATRRFKLAVRIGDVEGTSGARNMEGGGRKIAQDNPPPVLSLSEEQRQAVRALQRNLPVVEKPFDEIAREAHLSSAEALLVHAADFLTAGVLRRYAAVVHHVAAGAKANVMVAWRVPPEQADLAGTLAAEHAAVSHCYLRRTTPEWPYNLYTMLHGTSREACVGVLEELSRRLGEPERRDLWTTKEYKKSPVQLFPEHLSGVCFCNKKHQTQNFSAPNTHREESL